MRCQLDLQGKPAGFTCCLPGLIHKDGIAGQTGLLALNAAIAVAHAGEHDRDFAVVAAVKFSPWSGLSNIESIQNY